MLTYAMPAVLCVDIGRAYTRGRRGHSADPQSRSAALVALKLVFRRGQVLLALFRLLDIVRGVRNAAGRQREATLEEVGEAVVEQTKADLLTASTVATLIRVNVSTLVRWLDAREDALVEDDNAPSAIKRGHRYVFRPSVAAKWMHKRGYKVPNELRERAKRDAA